jgi:endogenous inhibitor of DNA gyrase (YacG/DUF329 family)
MTMLPLEYDDNLGDEPVTCPKCGVTSRIDEYDIMGARAENWRFCPSCGEEVEL